MNAQNQISTVAETPRRSVLVDMACRFGMEPAAFEATVRATCLPPDKEGRQATREEFAAFLLVAKEYNLNPLTKEIYGFRAKNGAIIPIVSVDGWSNMINSNAALDGIEFDDHLEGKNLTAITARIWRKDRSKPTVVTEYMDECRRDPDKTPWGKWPRRMLRHKALIQCARYAFGFGGIYDPDEAERIGADVSGMRTVSPRDDGPPAPPPRAAAIEHKPQHVASRQSDVELMEAGRDDGRQVEWGDSPAPQDDLDVRKTPLARTAPEFANWRNDAIGALSGCEDLESLFQARNQVVAPAKGKVSAEDWQAVSLVYKQKFDQFGMAD